MAISVELRVRSFRPCRCALAIDQFGRDSGLRIHVECTKHMGILGGFRSW